MDVDEFEESSSIHIFEWECPECGDTTASKIPQPGDTLNCAHCDYGDEVDTVEISKSPETPLGKLAGRWGFPMEAADYSWGEWGAYFFNRTMLGFGCMLIIWHVVQENWWIAGVGSLFIPIYFYLHRRVDAP